MCREANFGEGANKVMVCQLGDLKPGTLYRTPDGRTMMVLSLPASNGYTNVTDGRGQVAAVSNITKLGRDRKGRLYASRHLNPPVQSDAHDDRQAMILLHEEDVDDLDLNQSF